jgi:hypothetical protein
MGAIKTTELSNGNIGLEITYGGKEAPFGGVDTSAPPAYIDPACFTNCDGFIVVDNQLVAASLNPVAIPTLWNGTVGVILIGFGNFYTPKYGTLNYALGYKASNVSGPPTGVDYTFYMTAWVPGNPATYWNDTLNYTLFNSATPATKASVTVDLQTITGGGLGTGATVTIAAVTSVGYEGVYEGSYFYLDGILSTVTISPGNGGTNYVVGDTYWVVQGTDPANITAQVVVETVNPLTGAILTVSIVPDSYTATYTAASDSTSNHAAITSNVISTAGWGYSLGTATLAFAQPSDVVLQIEGPGGSSTYTVQSNGATPVTPTLPGSGAIIGGMAYDSGGVFQETSGWSYTSITGTLAKIVVDNNTSSSYPNIGGVNYSVGQAYYLDECYTAATASQVNGADLNVLEFISNPPVAVKQGTAKVLITAVGAGGSITGVQIIDSGLASDGFGCLNTTNVPGSTVVGFQTNVYALLRPVPLNTLTSSPVIILDAMAADINGLSTYPQDQNVTATVNISASSLTLTAIIAGTIGNSITVQDLSVITGSDASYYYFSCRSLTYLTGGSDGAGSGTVLSTVLPNKASIASVGGTLYIGNIGPAIIKYGGPGAFATSTTLQGVRVLRKFAGSLIGLGLIPAPGTVIASVDMIFAWSATNDLDTWAPLGLDGNVTGAGFAQLADIGDYLTGLIVTNATAFIIRSQGISYATATGNATSPFNFDHIGLGDEGEGAQVTALLAQYDQSGLYVGNSDVYQIANGITAVGAKIKTALFNALSNNPFRFFGNAACTVMINSETVLFLLAVGNVIYIYNPSNATWQTITLAVLAADLYSLALGVFASSNTTASSNLFNQCSPIIVVELSPQVYQFYELSEGVPNALSLSLPPSVTFPSEEVAFGRDITVDGIYSAISAQVSENVAMFYNLNGNVFSAQSLTPTEFDSLSALPVGTQVFPDSVTSSGAVTEHSPQLQISIAALPDTGTALVRLTKQAIFGSFDPRQRPV